MDTLGQLLFFQQQIDSLKPSEYEKFLTMIGRKRLTTLIFTGLHAKQSSNNKTRDIQQINQIIKTIKDSRNSNDNSYSMTSLPSYDSIISNETSIRYNECMPRNINTEILLNEIGYDNSSDSYDSFDVSISNSNTDLIEEGAAIIEDSIVPSTSSLVTEGPIIIEQYKYNICTSTDTDCDSESSSYYCQYDIRNDINNKTVIYYTDTDSESESDSDSDQEETKEPELVRDLTGGGVLDNQKLERIEQNPFIV
eukprot:507641_1